MIMESKRKKLVEIDLTVWAGVKHFATVQEISLNNAVELLLEKGLEDYEYNVKKGVMCAGKSLATTHQQTSQWRFISDGGSHELLD